MGKFRFYFNIDVKMSLKDYVYNKRMAFWDLIWKIYETKSVVYDP